MITVTLSLDTNAYGSGDVLAATQEVVGYQSIVGSSKAFLQSLTVIDSDDQKVAFDVYLLSSNVVMGTENAAPSISDGDAASVLGFVSVGAADYKDLGGVAVASIKNIGLSLSASPSLYVAVVNGTGTPTYSAAGVKLVLGFIKEV